MTTLVRTDGSASGRVIATVFWLFFVTGDIVACGVIGFMYVQNIRPRFWDRTDCTITASSVFERRSKVHYFTFKVQYQYHHGGTSYSSTVYQPNYLRSDDRQQAAALAAKYPIGSPAVCLVNPKNPSEAALEPGALNVDLPILLPFIFLAIGITVLVRLLRRKDPEILTDDTSSGEDA